MTLPVCLVLFTGLWAGAASADVEIGAASRTVAPNLATADTIPPAAAARPIELEPPAASQRTSLALLDGEILFGLGRYELTPEGSAALSELIDRLERFDQILSIRVIGHTDNLGSSEVNLLLSEGRARWIREKFVSRYPEAHILALGAGENAPIVSNETPAGRSRNRRVEVQVIAVGKPVAVQ